jgi:hypothetical protein
VLSCADNGPGKKVVKLMDGRVASGESFEEAIATFGVAKARQGDST